MLIQTIKKQLETFQNDLQEYRKLWLIDLQEKDNKKILSALSALFEKYPSHPLVIVEAIVALQLMDDEDIIDTYSLDDIRDLLELSKNIFPDFIDINLEYYYFTKNIDDDDSAADSFIDGYRTETMNKLSDLDEEDEPFSN